MTEVTVQCTNDQIVFCEFVPSGDAAACGRRGRPVVLQAGELQWPRHICLDHLAISIEEARRVAGGDFEPLKRSQPVSLPDDEYTRWNSIAC